MACPLGFGSQKDMYDDGGTEDDPYGEVDPAVKALNKKPLVPPTVTALLVIKALCRGVLCTEGFLLSLHYSTTHRRIG